MAILPLQESNEPGKDGLLGDGAKIEHRRRSPLRLASSLLPILWRKSAERVHGEQGLARTVLRDDEWLFGVLRQMPDTPLDIRWISNGDSLDDALQIKSLPPHLRVTPMDIHSFSAADHHADFKDSLDKVDCQVVDVSGLDDKYAVEILSRVLRSDVASLVRLAGGSAEVLLSRAGLTRSRNRMQVVDAVGLDVYDETVPYWADLTYFAIVPREGGEVVLRAVNAHICRMAGIPLGSEMLESGLYVRHVEVVALDTVARLGRFHFLRESLGRADFDLHQRRYRHEIEEIQYAVCKNVDLISHPAWKIVSENRFFVEEIAHSHPPAIFGVEYWPEPGGIWSVCKQAPLIGVPGQSSPFFLLGGDPNYYHWLLNFLPRLMTLDVFARHGAARIEDVNVLVPQMLPSTYIQLLIRLGVRPKNIVPVADNVVLHLETLIVPSFFRSRRLSPSIAAWYRRKFGTINNGGNKRRIFISRRDASDDQSPRRRIVNEADLLDALRPLGFVAYQLSGLSADAQISLFQEAEFVVGPHGAGFANMVFSPQDTKAVVLENSWNHRFMVDMISVSGGIARSIVCEDVIDAEVEAASRDANHLQELRRSRDMLANISEVVKVVTEMLDENASGKLVSPLTDKTAYVCAPRGSGKTELTFQRRAIRSVVFCCIYKRSEAGCQNLAISIAHTRKMHNKVAKAPWRPTKNV
jgi:Glycosyltransferase 61